MDTTAPVSRRVGTIGAFAYALAAVAAGIVASPARADTVEQLWEVEDDACAAEAAAADADGVVYVACHSMYDREWRLTAYDRGGALVAERRYNGLVGEPTPIGAYVHPTAVALDAAEKRLYVVGAAVFSADEPGPDEAPERAVVVAFALPSLTIEWELPVEDVRVLGDVAISPEGGIVASGDVYNGTDGDLVVVRIDAGGTRLWTEIYDSGADDTPGSSWDTLAVDSRGDIYALGYNTAVKLSSTGELQWIVERPTLTLALQDDRYVVVSTPLIPRGQTALFDLDGQLVWELDVGGFYVATADHGDVWVARTEYRDYDDSDWEVFRISDSGDIQWTHTVGDQRHDGVADIAIDADDNAYVTGTTRIRAGLFNMFWANRGTTLKLDANGNQRWRADFAPAPAVRELVLADPLTIYVVGLTGHVAYQQTIAEEPPELRLVGLALLVAEPLERAAEQFADRALYRALSSPGPRTRATGPRSGCGADAEWRQRPAC